MKRLAWLLLLAACRRDAPVATRAPVVADADAAIVDASVEAAVADVPDAAPPRPLPSRAKLEAFATNKAHGIVAVTDTATKTHLVVPDGERPVLLASFTKLFVAVATLRLVGRGAFSLDDTVKTLLPTLPARAWSDSTVRELLTHTSRVPEFDEHGGYYRRAGVDFVNPVAVLGKELSTATEKRGVWKYRNAEFALLGAILQEQTKKPAAQVLADEVFTPAGMKHAGILVARGPADLDLTPMGPIRPQNFFTAGNGYASPEDLLAFFDALDGDTLLDTTAKTTLFTGAADRHDGAFGCWAYRFAGRLLVERPGGFGNVRLVTAFFPEEHRALLAWSKEAPELGRPSTAKSPAAALARLGLE